MNFEYCLKGYGWADAVLEINGKRLEFDISYLCSPIRDLLESLMSIIPDYAATTITPNGEIRDTEARFIWIKEPGAYLWELKLFDNRTLRIRILHSRSYLGNVNDFKETDADEVLLNETCELREFVQTIVLALDKLINDEGLLGYKNKWDRNTSDDFPISELLLLKYYIIYNKGWNNAENGEWCLYDEIQLIQQNVGSVVTRRHSYKRIKSVLFSLVHSYFSLLNSPVDDIIFDAMKKQNITEMKILFNERKIEPAGEYPNDVWDSIDTYMKWLPELARLQNVDSSKIKDIVAIITKVEDDYQISVSSIDDRGYTHTIQVR